MRPGPKVVVLGAGVSGLTTAVVLTSQGYGVEVWTRDDPLDTTSCAAGALWGPYLVNDDRVGPWAQETRDEFGKLAADGPETGIRLVHGHEAARTAVPAPDWARSLPGFRPSTAGELPAGFVTGWWYEAPIVDMPTYLRYLCGRLAEAGGELCRRGVGSLDEALAAAPVVVNCTGFGARYVVPDGAVTPTRGQLVVVENPGVDTFFAEHDESATPTYILPQRDRVVLGGSAEPGSTDLAPDAAISAGILYRCAAVMPELRGATVVEERVGLRPSRPRIRVERVAAGDRLLVHNYGHGGGGITLSWGCAREVAALVEPAR
jgi:D-amino-acid oxidase